MCHVSLCRPAIVDIGAETNTQRNGTPDCKALITAKMATQESGPRPNNILWSAIVCGTDNNWPRSSEFYAKVFFSVSNNKYSAFLLWRNERYYFCSVSFVSEHLFLFLRHLKRMILLEFDRNEGGKIALERVMRAVKHSEERALKRYHLS